MNSFQACILGFLQGLTEFLPVSSSGHIELGKHVLGIVVEEDITFTIAVHLATVISTLIIFRKDIADMLREALAFQWNESTAYLAKILVSMVPVAVIGLFFKDYVASFFNGDIAFVGKMLLITALLLGFTSLAKTGRSEIDFFKAFVIGTAQAFAVLPGISRSGATIATGLLIGVDKTKIARFSFLMVIIPILGEGAISVIQGDIAGSRIGIMPMLVGFFSALFSGLIACRLMINIVRNSRLIYFAVYCAIIGLIAILS